jgi:hypothetical protein
MTPEQLAAINSRIADYRGRHARGEVTTLAHDIALIDAPLLIAALAAARRDAAACEERVKQLREALKTFAALYQGQDALEGVSDHEYRMFIARWNKSGAKDALAATPPAAPLPAEKGTDECSG